MIDIGGPSMLRAAAKNFAHVVRSARRSATPRSSRSCERRGGSDDTRRRLAAEAFATTAAYETAIATWFLGREAFPDRFIPASRRPRTSRTGRTPPARGVLRRGRRAAASPLPGRPAARQAALVQQPERPLRGPRLLGEFQLPAAVVVKHANPAGVAVSRSIEDAFRRAHDADPVSAYGMVLALNRPVTAELASWPSASSSS